MLLSDFCETSLQTLCIDVIVNNLDQYIVDFKNAKNAAEKRKFEFLQKVYSHKIITQLYQDEKLNENNLDVFVNKYIKVVDTDWFRDLPSAYILEKFKEVGSTLQEVHFNECHELPLPYIDILSFLSNVERLNFSSKCTNEILYYIGKFCRNVVDLDIADSHGVTDQGIINLCISENGDPCPKLRRIVIFYTAVKNPGVSHLLYNVPLLEEIDYRNLPEVLYESHKNDLSSLDKIKPYNITSLNLSHLKYSSIYSNCLKVCLAVCPHLKSLTCLILNTTDFELFSSLSELEKLHIDCDANNVINIDDLLKLKGKKLISLTVTWCTLSVFGLAEYCPNLKYFQLVDADFLYDQGRGIISYESIPKFPCLKRCIFGVMMNDAESNLIISKETLKAMSTVLNSSPVLEYVTLEECELSSPELRSNILKCCMEKPVKTINFTGSKIPVSFVKDILLNCHSLSSVSVEDCFSETGAELELSELSESLPNRPHLYFHGDNSNSDDVDEEQNAFHNENEYGFSSESEVDDVDYSKYEYLF